MAPITGGEDFAFMPEARPGAIAFLGRERCAAQVTTRPTSRSCAGTSRWSGTPRVSSSCPGVVSLLFRDHWRIAASALLGMAALALLAGNLGDLRHGWRRL
jgi:hypothetical protein